MDFMFFVKTVILTVAIILLMQIQVGKQTIESHTLGWVQNSAITGPINTVARGAGKLVHDITEQIHESVHHNVKKDKKDDSQKRSSSFFWQHSVKQDSASEN